VRARPLGQQGSELTYRPALDGLRGVAVLAVLLYHGGVGWAAGGFLGVEAFFVLSGYLITSLLLAEWEKDGTVHLGNFWARRARRLLPALFCLVVVTSIYEIVAGPGHAVPDFGADALATLLYIGNWHQIWTGNGYFAQAALVSPLQHTWSLAIEEQFYLVWPLVVLGMLSRFRRRHSGDRPGEPDRLSGRRLWPLLVLAVAGAVGSAAETAVLYGNGAGVNRVYYGTDTRAEGLLVGAAFATALAIRRRLASRSRSAPAIPARAGALAGLAGAAGMGLGIAEATGSSSWLYRGGWLGFDLCVVGVLAAAVSGPGRSPVRLLLETAPLRAVGLISYGLYLWHFPLYLVLDEQATGLSGAGLLVARLGASLAVATASFFLVEQPIRQRRVRGVPLRMLAAAATAAVVALVPLAWSLDAPQLAPEPRLAAAPVPDARSGHVTCTVPVPGATGSLLSPRRAVLHVCPPLRVLGVGDSIGVTLGVQLTLDAARYGVYFANEAHLGCSFTPPRAPGGRSGPGGSGAASPGWQVIAAGVPTTENPSCLGLYPRWRAYERELHAEAVVVEMGYWDTADWLEHGRVVHIGEPAFDRTLHDRMVALVRTLGSQRVPVIFLTVPVVDPPPLPNGSPEPQASPARNREINAMFAALARQYPGEVHVYDISPWVTPGGRFSTYVDGSVCRDSDGVHFAGSGSSFADFYQTACGERLQAAFLPWLRRLVLGRPATS
jgi:peptidoglycan/LPS O-acetylase OafA/YrhL